MERQLDQPCLTPEEAYVRSKDLLEKGISEDIAVADKQNLNQYDFLLSSDPLCLDLPRYAAIFFRLSALTC